MKTFFTLGFTILFSINLFSQNEILFYKIEKISIQGNHKTKDKIILRELMFSVGDSIPVTDTSNIKLKSEQNLINTTLFHYAIINFTDSGIIVSVKERWYIWPGIHASIDGIAGNVWLRNMNFTNVCYGVSFTDNNFRGQKEKLKVQIKNGYSKEFEAIYQIPFINKKQELGFFSHFGAKMSRSMNYSIENYELLYTRSDSSFIYKNAYAHIGFTLRKGIYRTHQFSIGMNYHNIDNNIFEINSQIYSNCIVKNLNINYILKFDHRDYKDYPLNGWYADIELNLEQQLSKNAGLAKNYYVKSTNRKYAKIYNRLYWASGLTIFYRFDKCNYFFGSTIVGLKNSNIRGYDNYSIPAKEFFLQKNNLKFEILPKKIIYTPWLKIEKFKDIPINIYVNAIFDWGMIEQSELLLPTNINLNKNLNNQILYSYGLGIDFATYYDKIFRIEYCRNGLGKNGLFLHFVAPI